MQISKIKNILLLVRNKRLGIKDAEMMLYEEFYTSRNNSSSSHPIKRNTTDMFM
jgi:hypothetical protein